MATAAGLARGPAAQVLNPADHPQVTFTKDIAPILQRACQNCHRPNSIAPMSLLTYQEGRPWARAIKQKVLAREMPPWSVEKTIGIQKFKDDPSLTDGEIATIVQWVDAGAPEGDPAELPPPRVFANATTWQIGKPDLIVTAPQFTVSPSGPDQWVDFFVDSGLKEDRYVKAIELKPSPQGFAVVHHATQYVIPAGAEASGSDLGRVNEVLNSYTVGKEAEFLPKGAGKLVNAGSTIQFNVHYHSIGKEITDSVRLGIVFYPKGVVPEHVFRTNTFGRGTYDLDIPANTADVRSDGYAVFKTAVKLVNFNPHMHSRGKRQCIEVIYPTARQEMLNCARVSFGWATVYNYADDVAPILPAGSVLHVINWHDNSVGLKTNPDSRQWVGWGNRTIDDMNLSWISWYGLTDAEYKDEVERRRAKPGAPSN
jgi:hypothetical protein